MIRNEFSPGSTTNICTSSLSVGRPVHKPFRIKMTPVQKPVSDKKDQKCTQPILIKDLLQSFKKEKNRVPLVQSVSTQKKKKPMYSSQPFLNTQSCEKPKNDPHKASTFFSRTHKTNVRRQLYSEISKAPVPETSNNKTKLAKSRQSHSVLRPRDDRRSQIVPPNSIKNQYLRKTTFGNLQPNKMTTTKGTTTTAAMTRPLRSTRSIMAKPKVTQNKFLNKSLAGVSRCDNMSQTESILPKQDNSTMTSPSDFPATNSGYIFLPSFDEKSKLKCDNPQLVQLRINLEESIKLISAQLAQLQLAHATLLQIQPEDISERDNTARISQTMNTSELNEAMIETKSMPIKIYEDETEENLQEMARLSTIGEVSCEVDETKSLRDENKENKEQNHNFLSPPKNIKIPKTPKSIKRRKTISDIGDLPRRRSERLSLKLQSKIDISDDSFVNLENELGEEHSENESKTPVPSKSAPVTPRAVQKWDKSVQKPLKEYLALKLNGTFLVTPDAKKFQSAVAETVDTPHSRKSLSRKIFMELCDLYAESPERPQIS